MKEADTPSLRLNAFLKAGSRGDDNTDDENNVITL